MELLHSEYVTHDRTIPACLTPTHKLNKLSTIQQKNQVNNIAPKLFKDTLRGACRLPSPLMADLEGKKNTALLESFHNALKTE